MQTSAVFLIPKSRARAAMPCCCGSRALLVCTGDEQGQNCPWKSHPERGLCSDSLSQELEIRPELILCINQQEKEYFILTGWPVSLPFTPHGSIDFIRICQAGMRAELGPLN